MGDQHHGHEDTSEIESIMVVGHCNKNPVGATL